jgi:ABC-type glutathione transport system ATPase component
VVLDGQRIDDMAYGSLRPMRRRMQVVFQDPFPQPQSAHARRATSWPSRSAISASRRIATDLDSARRAS